MQTDLTSPDIDLQNAESYKLEEGDIVFARTGASVGKTYIYKDFDGLVYYAGFLIRVKIKPEFSADFVFYNTLTKDYEKFIRITSQRSGQPGVNAQEYSEYEFYVPNYEEQTKISKVFDKIDYLITLHQREGCPGLSQLESGVNWFSLTHVLEYHYGSICTNCVLGKHHQSSLNRI